MEYCDICEKEFSTTRSFKRHLNCSSHKLRIENKDNLYSCHCGRKFLHISNLSRHKKTCQIPTTEPPQTESNVSQQMIEMKQQFEKERDEMKAQIALLMEKHAHSAPQNQTNIGEQTNNNNNDNNDDNIE